MTIDTGASPYAELFAPYRGYYIRSCTQGQAPGLCYNTPSGLSMPLGAKYGKMGMGVKIFKENYG